MNSETHVCISLLDCAEDSWHARCMKVCVTDSLDMWCWGPIVTFTPESRKRKAIPSGRTPWAVSRKLRPGYGGNHSPKMDNSARAGGHVPLLQEPKLPMWLWGLIWVPLARIIQGNSTNDMDNCPYEPSRHAAWFWFAIFFPFDSPFSPQSLTSSVTLAPLQHTDVGEAEKGKRAAARAGECKGHFQ